MRTRRRSATLTLRNLQIEFEAGFKTLKSDLHLCPIRHHVALRIDVHILVCFLAYMVA
jgi:transposase